MNSGNRESREPVCPFCKSSLDRPASIPIDTMETALGGKCRKCGALYLADPTGKSVGTIMIQALELLGRDLGKEMADLTPGVDYEDAVLTYNIRTHRSAGPAAGFGDGYGRMYVIKASQLHRK